MNTEPDGAPLMNELAMGREGALERLMKRWEVRLRCFIDGMCGGPTSVYACYQPQQSASAAATRFEAK